MGDHFGKPESGKKRVVIIGGGFGGAYAAQQLEKWARRLDFEVLLIDRRNYFIFYPLLVEAGTGALEPRHAVVAIRDFLKKTRFLMAEVHGVDKKRQEIKARVSGTDIEHTIYYDHIVIAMGSVTRMIDGLKGLRENAYELKSIGDSVGLRDRGLQMLELAGSLDDEEKRRELLSFVVVGGNYTGVEFAGEFQAFLNSAAKKRYKHLNRREIKMTLIEMQSQILPVLDKELADYATEDLRRRGIDVMTDMTTTEIGSTFVTLKDGRRIPTRTVVWAAGIAPPPILRQLPFETDERGYLVCERDLRVRGEDNAWALGDCAFNPDADGKPYPPTAQHATRMGKALAKNIAAVLQNEPTEEANIKGLGTLAAYGCYSAVAKVMGIRVTGALAWFMWRTVYLMKMPTLTRKIRVALDWTAELLVSHDTVQLGVHRLDRPRNAEQAKAFALPGGPHEHVADGGNGHRVQGPAFAAKAGEENAPAQEYEKSRPE